MSLMSPSLKIAPITPKRIPRTTRNVMDAFLSETPKCEGQRYFSKGEVSDVNRKVK